ncbi:hypothetical protein QYE76_002091 [Lolium multiflorum]|uniref:F-box domain-containing protein n=1 Tax=Lolium multiflorum TaxID=4521 RepID=A0AAD8RQ08_LOLMU|nr:hypothetical protein QYE76_002091 [Lolium multiflorum]
MERTHEDSLAGVDSSIGDDLPKDAIGPHASSSWSDLPTDLLLSILKRLELRESFAFASVCTSWFSAAAAAGIPLTCRPWLMSWAHLVEERDAEISCSSAVTCQFRHLLDVNKSYDLDFPKGCFVACCGASHGWLVLANELANLVLFNPITMEMVPLPPITDFTFVDAVYDDQGSIRGYHIFYKDKLYEAKDVATWFYQKAVLSCTPSKDGNYTVMIIHYDSNWLSFARAGESKWHVVSTLAMSERDRYADCAYHNGRFYTVTYQGIVEKYEHDGSNGPTKEAIIAHRNFSCVLTRHLVSTPWGDLLQVRAISAKRVENVRFDIDIVHPEGCKKVLVHDLMEHAIFVGLNHSTCLPAKKFPGLRPQCIYFSAPWMTHKFELMGRCRGWGGVRSYDIERNCFNHAFPIEVMPKRWRRGLNIPSEVWITPNI